MLDLGEDVDGDGNLDVAEDIDGDGNLDVAEDIDGDGNLDIAEDLDEDGNLDVNEVYEVQSYQWYFGQFPISEDFGGTEESFCIDGKK